MRVSDKRQVSKQSTYTILYFCLNFSKTHLKIPHKKVDSLYIKIGIINVCIKYQSDIMFRDITPLKDEF